MSFVMRMVFKDTDNPFNNVHVTNWQRFRINTSTVTFFKHLLQNNTLPNLVLSYIELPRYQEFSLQDFHTRVGGIVYDRDNFVILPENYTEIPTVPTFPDREELFSMYGRHYLQFNLPHSRDYHRCFKDNCFYCGSPMCVNYHHELKFVEIWEKTKWFFLTPDIIFSEKFRCRSFKRQNEVMYMIDRKQNKVSALNVCKKEIEDCWEVHPVVFEKLFQKHQKEFISLGSACLYSMYKHKISWTKNVVNRFEGNLMKIIFPVLAYAEEIEMFGTLSMSTLNLCRLL